MPTSSPHSVLAALAATAPDCLICTDRAGLVLEFNAAAEATFGWRREEVLGKRVFEFLIPPPVRDLHPMMLSAYRPGKPSKVVGRRQELPVLRRDGTQFLVELSLSTLEVAGATVFVTHLRDIADRLEAERTLRAEAANAATINRVQMAFLAKMSHEVRTPLAAITGALQLLEESPLTREDLRLVRVASQSATALTQLLDDVLDFVELDSGAPAPGPGEVSLVGLLEGVASLLEANRREQDCRLVASIDPEVPARVVIGRDRLRQLTVTLASVALRFAAGSEAVLRLSCGGPGCLRLEAGAEGESPASRPGEGGIRLALCQRLAKAMGGSSGVESGPAGFLLWAEVPWQGTVAAAVEAGPTAPPMSEPALTGSAATPLATAKPRSLRVLLAEDSQSNRLVLTELLRRRGCEVDVAVDGREAVESVQRLLPDLVLMDIDMPVLDGPGALRAIREMPAAAARLPVIAMTAHAAPGARNEFLAAGFDDYLAKPVDADHLMATLQRWKPAVAVLVAADHRVRIPDAASVVPAVPGPGPAEAPVLEPGALHRLAKEVGEARLPRMIRIFCEELERRAGLLQVAADAGDLVALGRESHVLKGSAATFGAHELQRQAQATNEACRRGDSPTALASAGCLLAVVAPTLAALRAAVPAG